MVMDQSTSMNHRLNSGQSKAAFLADVLNKTLYTIITNCSKSDGVRDYFDVGVVAYGAKDAANGFQGALGEEPLHVISRLAEAPLRRGAVSHVEPASAARLGGRGAQGL